MIHKHQTQTFNRADRRTWTKKNAEQQGSSRRERPASWILTFSKPGWGTCALCQSVWLGAPSDLSWFPPWSQRSSVAGGNCHLGLWLAWRPHLPRWQEPVENGRNGRGESSGRLTNECVALEESSRVSVWEFWQWGKTGMLKKRKGKSLQSNRSCTVAIRLSSKTTTTKTGMLRNLLVRM